jgi:phosphatidylinositol alpha-1,6-mannosyltransferase
MSMTSHPASARHLLVTNDFPPKIGGIQSYLWELWRRLPPDEVTVLTSPHVDADLFDRQQAFRIERTREPVLLPNPLLTRRVRDLAAKTRSTFAVLDPAIPLGMIGPGLGIPYAVVLHGAEVTVPGRIPGTKQMLAKVLRNASLIISAGGYAEAEARHTENDLPPVAQIPPGVDVSKFVPLPPIEKASTRARLGLPTTGPLVLSVSRLVPRKGMDVLIEAAARLKASGRQPDLNVVIAGEGRDRTRLEHLINKTNAPARLLGRVPSVDLHRLYACADVFVLSCRSRWGGLEQEGFGIVFLEAGAAGIPAVAGDSGGAAEAVVDGETGIVIHDPTDAAAVARAIDELLSDPALASRQGQAARHRAETEYSYDVLAARLAEALGKLSGTT